MTLAYLDPASGSMIVSAVVGGVAGVGVFAKQARAKFGRKKRPEFEPTESTESTDVTTADTEGPGSDTADDGAEPVEAQADAAEAADEPTTVSSDR